MIRQNLLLSVTTVARILAPAMVATVLAAGCKPQSAAVVPPAPPEAPCTGGATPDAAVMQLVDALRRNQLDLLPCRAVPPELLPPLELAWRENRSRWPLSELPLSARLPAILDALNKPGAELTLKQGFNRQFAGQGAELQSAARGLGLFAVRYIQKEAHSSPAIRAHHADLIVALTDWSSHAQLGDRDKGHQVIGMLVDGAKASGVHNDAGLTEAGMRGSLRQLAPLYDAARRVTALYGLPLDDALESLQATTLEQSGDRARVRIHYRVAGKDIEVEVGAERLNGRWYTSGMLESARKAAAPRPPEDGATDLSSR